MIARLAPWRRPGVPLLLVVLFVAVQVTALCHEFEHIAHRHDAPCGLHVVADHQMFASAPDPALPVAPAPAVRRASARPSDPPALPPRPHGARASPIPA